MYAAKWQKQQVLCDGEVSRGLELVSQDSKVEGIDESWMEGCGCGEELCIFKKAYEFLAGLEN